MLDADTSELAAQILTRLRRADGMIVTVESCTGGLIAAALTSQAGSSDVVHGGFVTYANDAKIQMTGVPEDVLDAHGAVSEPVARAMATGALAATQGRATIAVSVTGIAGPGGGSKEKPVGLVHFACATNERVVHRRELFQPALGRDGIRAASVRTALQLVGELLGP